MRAFLTLVRREVTSYYFSMTGYVIGASVLLLLGVSFSVMLEAYNGDSVNAPLTELFYSTMFFWLILLVATPVITMRAFALEKASGTYETLMTTPVSDVAVVLAKFSAALLFYVVMWLPLLGCLYVVHTYTGQGSRFDWWPTAATFAGITLVGSLYVSMGCFASALTRSQIIAAMITFALGVSLFLLSFLKYGMGSQGGWLYQAVTCLSLIDHMEDFARGVIDTRHVTFHLSFTILFLFLTVKVVESRRWK